MTTSVFYGTQCHVCKFQGSVSPTEIGQYRKCDRQRHEWADEAHIDRSDPYVSAFFYRGHKNGLISDLVRLEFLLMSKSIKKIPMVLCKTGPEMVYSSTVMVQTLYVNTVWNRQSVISFSVVYSNQQNKQYLPQEVLGPIKS